MYNFMNQALLGHFYRGKWGNNMDVWMSGPSLSLSRDWDFYFRAEYRPQTSRQGRTSSDADIGWRCNCPDTGIAASGEILLPTSVKSSISEPLKKVGKEFTLWK